MNTYSKECALTQYCDRVLFNGCGARLAFYPMTRIKRCGMFVRLVSLPVVYAWASVALFALLPIFVASLCGSMWDSAYNDTEDA